MKSPFKFLEAYTQADKDVYFGRQKETKTLYQYIHATSLVLLYGLSGTGKTSLVQCGLAERFDGPDWYPFFIRRGNDINHSVQEALKKTLPVPPATDDLPTLIHTVFRHYFRPIYLIFDQFEELFTLKRADAEGTDAANRQEQEQFFESLHALLATDDIPCKIILVMREEFIGQLYEYERVVPGLFDFRLRVEPMNFRTIREVVEKTFAKFNIGCESPSLSDSISNNLLKGQATSQLAYLQVYMDRLWREAYEQRYGDQNLPESNPPIRISEQTLNRTGDVGNVLQKYLDDQEKIIQKSLPVPIQTVLDYFVTPEGTKQPVAYDQQDDLLRVPKINLPTVSDETLSRCLLELEKARLIRRDDARFLELAHDSLAGIIDQKRTAEQRLLNDLIRNLTSSYVIYQNQGGYLNEQQVALYDQFQEKLPLDPPMRQYIEKSREEHRREAENLRTANEKLNRNFKVALAAIVIALGLSVWSYLLYRQSDANLAQFKTERAKLLYLDAQTYRKSEDYEEALDNALEAQKLKPDPAINQEVEELTKLVKLNQVNHPENRPDR